MDEALFAGPYYQTVAKRIPHSPVPSRHSFDGDDLYWNAKNAPLLASDRHFPIRFRGSSAARRLGSSPSNRPCRRFNCMSFLLLSRTIRRAPDCRHSRPPAGLRPDVSPYQHLRLGSSCARTSFTCDWMLFSWSNTRKIACHGISRLGFFFLGLALWNKAVFVWALAGLICAAVSVFRRELSKMITRRQFDRRRRRLSAGLPALRYL